MPPLSSEMGGRRGPSNWKKSLPPIPESPSLYKHTLPLPLPFTNHSLLQTKLSLLFVLRFNRHKQHNQSDFRSLCLYTDKGESTPWLTKGHKTLSEAFCDMQSPKWDRERVDKISLFWFQSQGHSQVTPISIPTSTQFNHSQRLSFKLSAILNQLSWSGSDL